MFSGTSARDSGPLARTVRVLGILCAGVVASPLEAQPSAGGVPEESIVDDAEEGRVRTITTEEALPRDIAVFSGIGDVELAIGLSYTRSSRLENLRVQRSRAVGMPLSLSIGLGRRVELSLGTSLSYGEREELSLDDARSESERTLGDVSLGLSWQLREESIGAPAVSLSLGGALPIDDAEGAGSLSIGAGISRRIDPVLLFGSIGYGGALGSRDIDGSRIRDGDGVSYGFGLSFVVNSVIVLTSRFDGTFGLESSRDGETLDGSGTEPMYLVSSVGYAPGGRGRWSVSLTRGLNDDAGDVEFGVSLVHDLRGRR